jgi:hypothetical protein
LCVGCGKERQCQQRCEQHFGFHDERYFTLQSYLCQLEVFRRNRFERALSLRERVSRSDG